MREKECTPFVRLHLSHALLLALLCMSLSLPTQASAPSEADRGDDAATYTNEIGGFSTDYPSGWFRKDHGSDYTSLYSYDPSQTPPHARREEWIKIDIGIDPVGSAPATLDAWRQDIWKEPRVKASDLPELHELNGGITAYLGRGTSGDPHPRNYGVPLAKVNSYPIRVGASGDLDPFDPILAILATSRPLESQKSISMPGCGNKIAFVDGDLYQLWTMNLNGTDRRQLTHLPEGQKVFHPQWFPDGRRLIFTTHATSYTINADGSGLTALPRDFETPALSPDGERVAGQVQLWKKLASGGNALATANIMVARVDGQGSINLTGCPETTPCNAWSPSWSPDGRRLAFVGGLPATSPMAIYVAESDAPGSAKRLPGTEKMLAVAWSPDGAWLAACRIPAETGNPLELVLVRPDGSELTPLRVQVDGSNPPSWSPDSQLLLLSYNQNIKIIDLKGRTVAELGRGRDPSWQPCPQVARPKLPTADLIKRKEAAVAFLEHPPFDVHGLAEVSLKGYDESATRSLMNRLRTDQAQYEGSGMTTEKEQAHQRSVEAFSRFALTEEALVQLYPMIRDTNSDLIDKNVDIVFASASVAVLVKSGLQKAAAKVLGEQAAAALIRKTAYVVNELQNQLWEAAELGIRDEETRLVSRNIRETLYKAALAKLALSGPEVSKLKVFEEFAGDPIKTAVLAAYMQHFINRSQPLIDRGADRVNKAVEESWYDQNVHGTFDEASTSVQTVVNQAQAETVVARHDYETYKERSNVASIVAKSDEMAQIVASGSSDAGWFGILIASLDDVLKMCRSFYEMVAGDKLGDHSDRLLRLVKDAELHSWAPNAPRTTRRATDLNASSAGSLSANFYPASYSVGESRDASLLTSRMTRLQDASAELDSLLAQVAETIRSGERERKLHLLEKLLAADDAYSRELQTARAAALPADSSTLQADEVHLYRAVSDAESLFAFSGVRLYWQIAAIIAVPADSSAQSQVEELAQVTRAALSQSKTLVSDALIVAAEADAPRRIAVTALALPDNVESEMEFELAVILQNPGRLALDSVECRLRGENVEIAEPTLQVGGLAGGAERRVSFKAIAGKPGSGLLVVEVWANKILQTMSTAQLEISGETVADRKGSEDDSRAAQSASDTPTPQTPGETTAPDRVLPCPGALLIALLALGLFAARRAF